MWMVRIYVGRDPEIRKRNYIGKSITGGLRAAQAHLTHMLAERDLGRNIRSSKQTLAEYLDHWLDICARPRLRAKSFRDYTSLLARYVRPRLGARPLGESRRLKSKRSTASCWTRICRRAQFGIRTQSFSRLCVRRYAGSSFSRTLR
jgi:hypothetical protein